MKKNIIISHSYWSSVCAVAQQSENRIGYETIFRALYETNRF